MTIQLRATTANDLDDVHLMENDAENSPFIGNWTLDQHRESLSNSDIHHFIIEDCIEKKRIGYAIIKGLESPHKSLELMRIVSAIKGRGIGRQAIRKIQEWAFSDQNAHRLWLDVRTNNPRAKHLYESCGFKVEGELRECIFEDQQFHSLYVLSILKQEFNN